MRGLRKWLGYDTFNGTGKEDRPSSCTVGLNLKIALKYEIGHSLQVVIRALGIGFGAKMESKLSRLSLDARPTDKATAQKPKGKAPVIDSWDEESLSDSDTEIEGSPGRHASSLPSAPPPTPISPSAFPPWDHRPGTQSSPYPSVASRDRGEEERKRPEKSTAVAGRLIAAGLGVKVPKRTEEQRAYDRAIKEQEIKRKNREKAAKEKEREEAEEAKTAVWNLGKF